MKRFFALLALAAMMLALAGCGQKKEEAPATDTATDAAATAAADAVDSMAMDSMPMDSMPSDSM